MRLPALHPLISAVPPICWLPPSFSCSLPSSLVQRDCRAVLLLAGCALRLQGSPAPGPAPAPRHTTHLNPWSCPPTLCPPCSEPSCMLSRSPRAGPLIPGCNLWCCTGEDMHQPCWKARQLSCGGGWQERRHSSRGHSAHRRWVWAWEAGGGLAASACWRHPLPPPPLLPVLALPGTAPPPPAGTRPGRSACGRPARAAAPASPPRPAPAAPASPGRTAAAPAAAPGGCH